MKPQTTVANRRYSMPVWVTPYGVVYITEQTERDFLARCKGRTWDRRFKTVRELAEKANAAIEAGIKEI